MRSLVVGMTWPWPTTAGPRYRHANTVRALASVGDVDLVVMPDRRHERPVEGAGGDAPPEAVR